MHDNARLQATEPLTWNHCGAKTPPAARSSKRSGWRFHESLLLMSACALGTPISDQTVHCSASRAGRDIDEGMGCIRANLARISWAVQSMS
jgi:hypothetical protein